jgi:glutamine synthetase
MSLALPNTVLNTIVAEAIDDLAGEIERLQGGGESFEGAVLSAVSAAWAAHKRIVFDGDNYADEWHTEAEKRGLANLRQTPDALPWLLEPSTVEVFGKYEVLSERELESRYEVLLEQYVTTLNIEGETAASMARTMLLPAESVFALETANRDHPQDGEGLDEAKYVQTTVLPAMDAARAVADRLERIVPDDLWPLPKYSEILFIK